MRVLFLGNSNETYGGIAAEDRRAARVARSMEGAFGEPVEMSVRGIWPNAGLARSLEGWMAEFEPDIVYLNVVAFWFNYPSVPLKFERMFGRLGRPVREAGVKASQIPWLGHTRAFHWLRTQCQRAIGGATFFEPDEVISVVSDCVRVVVRHEGTVLVVKGPRGRQAHNPTARSLAWAEARRQRVHGALAALCETLHVEYIGAESPRYLTNPATDLLGDRLHAGAEGHVETGDEVAGFLTAAWERQHGSVSRE